jgi:hypothetical protein
VVEEVEAIVAVAAAREVVEVTAVEAAAREEVDIVVEMVEAREVVDIVVDLPATGTGTDLSLLNNESDGHSLITFFMAGNLY